MHLTIGVTLYNIMPVETFISINNLIFEMLEIIQTQKGFSWSFINSKGLPIDRARNSIVAQFLKTDSECLVFLDADMIFPQNLIKKLLSMDGDISSGIAFKKWWPHLPTIYRFDGENHKAMVNYPKNKIIEVDGVGMFACIIKRKVLETIQQPWFEFKEKKDYKLKKIFVWSEDLVFCKKVKEAGFNIKVDTGLICGHVGGIVDNKTFEGVSKLDKQNDFLKRGNL